MTEECLVPLATPTAILSAKAGKFVIDAGVCVASTCNCSESSRWLFLSSELPLFLKLRMTLTRVKADHNNPSREHFVGAPRSKRRLKDEYTPAQSTHTTSKAFWSLFGIPPLLTAVTSLWHINLGPNLGPNRKRNVEQTPGAYCNIEL
jgi:hypothetical protein